MTLSSRLLPRPTVPADKSTNFDKAIRGGFSASFFSSWLPSAVSSERRSNIEPPSSACSQPPLEVSNQMQAVEECTFAQRGAQLLGACVRLEAGEHNQLTVNKQRDIKAPSDARWPAYLQAQNQSLRTPRHY